MGDHDPSATGPHVEVIDDRGRPALAIDGAVQSVAVGEGAAPSGYWPAMLPDQAPREALLLGLGGGTIVHLLVGAFGPLPIVGVDDDSGVVELARTHFGLDLPNLQIVVGDAFAYVAGAAGRFDFVCVDLYRDGAIPAEVCASRFLAHVRRLLRPGGTATFNLARDRRAGDRLRQLDRHFVVTRRIRVGFNLVVHCALEPPTALDNADHPTARPGHRRGRQLRRGRGRARRSYDAAGDEP